MDFGELGYPGDPELQVLVDRSADFIEWAMGRVMDGTLDPKYQKMAEQAVQYKTEMLAYQDQPDLVETAADFMLISSFSVGSYSETRRSLKDLLLAGMIDVDPRLNSILWMLMTDEMRDFWLGWLRGENAPAFSVTEVDWSGRLLPGVLGDGELYVPSDPYGIWPN